MSFARASFTAKLGLIIVIFYVLVALVGPFLAPYKQSDIVGGVWEPTSAEL